MVTEGFNVWYDNSSSFCKLSHGWVWFCVSFLLGFALLNDLCQVVVVLKDVVKMIHFFSKKFRCRTYLFSSVDGVWITYGFAKMGWLEVQSKYLSMWVDFLQTVDSVELGVGLIRISRKRSPSVPVCSMVIPFIYFCFILILTKLLCHHRHNAMKYDKIHKVARFISYK